MSEPLLYLLVAAAVGISAVALVAQTVASFAIVRVLKRMREKLDELSPRAEAVLASADKTLTETRREVAEVSAKANEVLDSARSQMKLTDEFLTEAIERARVQLDRVELVLDDTISRVHETVILVNEGVVRPVREVTGIAAGVRTAFRFLLAARRPNVSQATIDEEMFI